MMQEIKYLIELKTEEEIRTFGVNRIDKSVLIVLLEVIQDSRDVALFDRLEVGRSRSW